MYQARFNNNASTRRSVSKQRGVIMLDIIIGSVVGLIILSAAIKVYIDTIKANAETLISSKLNQEVNAILLLVSTDVRRAGFWAADPKINTPQNDLKNNPFTEGFNDISVSAKTGEANNSCVIYSYDLNKDKVIGVDNGGLMNPPFDTAPYNNLNVEQFGFRLNNGNLEMRQGLALGDTDVGCDNGIWTRVNNNSVSISNFELLLSAPCYKLDPLDPTPSACVSGLPGQVIRNLEINITVSLSNNVASHKSGHTYVNIRNDKFIASYP